MERNYGGNAATGYYSSSVQASGGSIVGSGRRAGQAKADLGPAAPSGYDYPSYGVGEPRFGRRASPGAMPSGSGMDFEPAGRGAPAPRPGMLPATYTAMGATPPAPSTFIPSYGRPAPIPGGMAVATPSTPTNKLAGLQRLKDSANARMANRIPSATRDRPPSQEAPAMTGGHRPGRRPAAVPSTPTYSAPPQQDVSAMPLPKPPAPLPVTAPIRVPGMSAPAPVAARPAAMAVGGGYGYGGSGNGFPAGAIPPGAADVADGPSVKCNSCGRTFNEQAYKKHAKVCEKVFAKKAKPVNMAAKRVGGTEAAKYFDIKKGVPKSEASGKAAEKALPKGKLPKWKAQSEQLRSAMGVSRKIADAQAKGIDIRTLDLGPTPEELDDRVPCPYCKRKFAPLTAERHIPKCKESSSRMGR